MLQPTFFNTAFVFPTLNLLVLFYQLFLFIRLPAAFGFAIITLTVFIRVILNPFFHKQMHTAKKMQELKPHLDKLSAQHKKDPKKLQQEQMKLYQEAGINPLSGCLFMIIQMPIFIGLYQTLSLFFNGNMDKVIMEINKVVYFSFLKVSTIDPWFFGLNLAMTPAKSDSWVYYLIPVITAIFQYFQVQMSMPQQPAQQIQKKKEGEDHSEDFQKTMNTQMKFMFPILIGYAAYSLPVGLSLYWNIFSIFSIIQGKSLQKSQLPVTELKTDSKK